MSRQIIKDLRYNFSHLPSDLHLLREHVSTLEATGVESVLEALKLMSQLRPKSWVNPNLSSTKIQ